MVNFYGIINPIKLILKLKKKKRKQKQKQRDVSKVKSQNYSKESTM